MVYHIYGEIPGKPRVFGGSEIHQTKSGCSMVYPTSSLGTGGVQASSFLELHKSMAIFMVPASDDDHDVYLDVESTSSSVGFLLLFHDSSNFLATLDEQTDDPPWNSA